MKRTVLITALLILLCTFTTAGTINDFTLKRTDGSTFTLSEIKGKKIVVIDFWATWCKPCKKYMKKLQKISTKYKDSVEVVAISIDDTSAFSRVDSYIKGKRFTFTVLLDPDRSVAKSLNPALRVPFTMVMDKEGKVIWTHTGYMPGDERELEKELKKLIDSKR